MNIVRKTSAGLAAGIALIVAAAAPVAAQTDLTIENDGAALTAGAVSGNDILSIRLRITGPNEYVFEKRVEDSLIQWVPEGKLADGIYRWEALAVTVEPGAPIRELSTAYYASSGADSAQGQGQSLNDRSAKQTIDAPSANDTFEQIPVERLYSDEFKTIERRTGSFRVEDGWIQPEQRLDEAENGEGTVDLSVTDEPGVFGRVAGAVVDFFFPSAHATTNVDDILQVQDVQQDNATRVYWDTDSTSLSNWWLQNDNGDMQFVEFAGAGEQNRLVIEGAGSGTEVGIGTSTPTQPLHIADQFPRIRLEDTSDSQTWYIKGMNAGAFEIAETTTGGGVFSIQAGAPNGTLAVDSGGNVGIGTTAPARKLHVLSGSGPQVRLEAPSGGLILGGTAELFVGGTGLWFNDTGGQAIVKFNHAASANTLVVEGNGVGIGTQSPSQKLHVRASDGSSSMLLEETQAISTNTMLTMRHNGNPGFLLENTDQSTSWQFRLGGSGSTEQFTVNKAGTGGPELSVLANGDIRIKGSYLSGSSRELKQDIDPIESPAILEKLEQLPIYEWSYKRSPSSRHIGPMAEDYHATFGLAGEGTGLAATDLAGLSLASIKALVSEVKTLKEDNLALQARIAKLEDTRQN
ncbi:MAG: tail fiber domain-containing protein [Candidatus Wenzhouxiangella sp. M2_3B_020]